MMTTIIKEGEEGTLLTEIWKVIWDNTTEFKKKFNPGGIWSVFPTTPSRALSQHSSEPYTMLWYIPYTKSLC